MHGDLDKNQKRSYRGIVVSSVLLLFFILFIVYYAINSDNSPIVPVAAPENPQAGDLLEFTFKGVEYRFHWCPAGKFTMGSPSSEQDRSCNEKQHEVTLTRGFWMAETEATQAMWESVIGNNPSEFKGANLPVEQVTWGDCQEFIGKLNSLRLSRTGYKFSLPTEAQWEYACRAGTTDSYAGDLDAMAWYNEDYFTGSTHPVGTKRANAWGLYDMHGNVWEWCSDWYGDYDGDVTDPVGGGSGSRRVYRGGAWLLHARNCRSAYRFRLTPDFRDSSHGFRLSLVLK